MASGPAPPRSPPYRTSVDLPEISVTSPNSTDRKTKIPFFSDNPVDTAGTGATREEDARGRSGSRGVSDGKVADNIDDEDGNGEQEKVRPRTPARSNCKTASRSREERAQSASSWASPGRRLNGQLSNYATPNGAPQRPESSAGNSEEPPQTRSPPMDPLSQHILDRTTLDNFTSSPDPPSTTSNLQRVSTNSSTDDHVSRDNEKASSEYSRSAAAVQSPHQPPRRGSLDTTTTSEAGHKDLRKSVKAVSFITRLIGSNNNSNNNRKKEGEAADLESLSQGGHLEDETAISNEEQQERPEGNDARVFAETADALGRGAGGGGGGGGGAGGYNLQQHSQPPAYIKVRSKYKKQRELDHLFLAQELDGYVRRDGGMADRQNNSSNKLRRKSAAVGAATAGGPEPQTVWAMEFSRDGKYLAAAGVDGVVRVWAVLSSFEDRLKHEQQERGGGVESSNGSSAGRDGYYEHLTSPVFQTQPVREYEGHSGTVLDLSWSKNNFLLSSSMDKTVRLWHVSRGECLCTFKHKDIVPSVAFHPRDDRFFLAGSLDGKLRLWSVSEKTVAFTAGVPDMITAVAFTPDGKAAVAGCNTGLCMFFETDGLKYQSQIHVRSTRGQNAKESKITGIQAFYAATGEGKLLVTTNDSRIRLYNFRDKNLEMKFRGHVNSCSLIRASVCDDSQSSLRVVSGSEDCKAYVWSINGVEADSASAAEQRLRGADRRPVEFFEAHDFVTTVACFAPAKTRSLLAKSQDAVYDLCNPPPLPVSAATPVSSSSLPYVETPQAMSSSTTLSSKPATENGSIQSTPKEAEAPFSFENANKHSFSSNFNNRFSPSLSHHQSQHQQHQYLSKTYHSDGQILVTADLTGRIKVFRQDCAWQKRRDTPSSIISGGGAADEADRASIFSKRGSSTNTTTGNNGGKMSRQGSTGTMASTRSQRILHREHHGAAAAGASAPSERIISWRQGVVSSPNLADGAVANGVAGTGADNGTAAQHRQSQTSSTAAPRHGSSPWSFIPGAKKHSVVSLSDGGNRARTYPATSSSSSSIPVPTAGSAAQSRRKLLRNIDTGAGSAAKDTSILGSSGLLSASPTSTRGAGIAEHSSNSHNQNQHQDATTDGTKNAKQSSHHDNAHHNSISGAGAHSTSDDDNNNTHPSPNHDNPLMISEGGRSMYFYNTEEWRARAARMHQAAHAADMDTLSSRLTREEEDGKAGVRGRAGASGAGGDGARLGVGLPQRPGFGGRRDESFASRLSDERGSSVWDEEEEEFDDARER